MPRPIGGDLHPAEGPGVGEVGEEAVDPVDRRQHEPVVGADPCRRGAAGGAPVGRFADLDDRAPRRRPRRARAAGRTSAGAWARARVTTTVRPNSGRRTNQSSSCAATSPDDDHRRRRELVVLQRRQRRPHGALAGRVPHWTAAAGVDGSSPPRTSRSLMAGQRATAIRITMVPPTRATASQSTVVVEVRVLVAGHDRERGRRVAQRHRDARGGGTANAEVMPGTTSYGDAGLGQHGRLLAAAGEHERVAALQPHDGLAGPAPLDQQRADVLLGHRVAPRRLADVDPLGARRRQVEQLGGRQPVVHHHVGPAPAAPRPAP